MPAGRNAIQLVEHTITLAGNAFEGEGVEPDVEHFFWKRLERSLIDAARITVYGASRKVGRSVKPLEEAWQLRKRDEGPDPARGGRTFVALVPRLGEAAPTLFKQKSLFGDDLDPDDTLIDWVGDIAAAVWEEHTDSARLDSDLLGHLAGFKQVPHGFVEASIRTRRFNREGIRVNEEFGKRAEKLVIRTPQPQRTRIKATLNQMSYFERGLLLNLSGGHRLRVVWEGDDLEALRDLWGREVTIEGLLQYKPNGQPQVLVADAIRSAQPQDAFWTELPEAIERNVGSGGRLVNGGTANPLFQLRGVLDGEMDDAAFYRRLEEFSHA